MCIQGDQGGAGVPGDVGFQGDKVIVPLFFIIFSPFMGHLCGHQPLYASSSREELELTAACCQVLFFR